MRSITVDENGRLAAGPAVPAARVDVNASVAAIAEGLLAGKDEIALVVDETPAEICKRHGGRCPSRAAKISWIPASPSLGTVVTECSTGGICCGR